MGQVIREADNFTCYLHDNFWRGAQPAAELDQYCGVNKWTKYMGRPCTIPHPTAKTPVRKRPVRMPAPEYKCTFPDGPVHAAYFPKLNLVEETFDKINRQMTKNKRTDALNEDIWPIRGVGKKTRWKAELHKAIAQVNEDKTWFKQQYDGYMKRCDAYIASNGKRLKRSKW